MLAKMKFVGDEFACSEGNEMIYVVGGYGSDGYGLSPAEDYVPDKNEWTLIEKLRKPWGPCFGGKRSGFYTQVCQIRRKRLSRFWAQPR
ncbi:hypothetical protein KSP40_PGU000524 [Platanthera guangdongensis]|uniref:Uncharacterized protein n=1 Tax=Platanthera guangdongensis TaxID=2320717 RepID=A0ABR2MEG2_9ASPA